MAQSKDTGGICPVHRLLSAIAKSRVVRAAAAVNVGVLKFMRDRIDRRLVELAASERGKEKEGGA